MTLITNLSNQPTDYSNAVKACQTLDELRAVLKLWQPLAADAYAVAVAMKESDWPEYVRGKEAEARNEFGGEDWYNRYKAILFPAVMFQVGIWAEGFGAPWGATFQRAVRAGAVYLDEEKIYQLK